MLIESLREHQDIVYVHRGEWITTIRVPVCKYMLHKPLKSRSIFGDEGPDVKPWACNNSSLLFGGLGLAKNPEAESRVVELVKHIINAWQGKRVCLGD